MVTLASPAATGPAEQPARAEVGLAWTVAAGAMLLVALGVRVALGGGGVGDRSAIVMLALLSVGVWLGARLLSSPRTAFLVTLGVLALLDLAALPARNAPDYDYREAFYRTDQVLSAQTPTQSNREATALEVLAEPVFTSSADQPPFGLAGEIGNTTLVWDCPFQRGLQHLALAVPPGAITSSGTIDVRLHLTGSPSRETVYLLVYASAQRGGFLVSLVGAGDLRPGDTVCAVRP